MPCFGITMLKQEHNIFESFEYHCKQFQEPVTSKQLPWTECLFLMHGRLPLWWAMIVTGIFPAIQLYIGGINYHTIFLEIPLHLLLLAHRYVIIITTMIIMIISTLHIVCCYMQPAMHSLLCISFNWHQTCSISYAYIK